MKNTIRKNFLEKRNRLNKKYITENSNKIWEKIFQTKEFQICENIFTFISFGNEIDTNLFIEKALKMGKIVCVPIVKEKGKMIFSKIDSLQNLKLNKYGILEPIFENRVVSNKKTLIIVPALVYSLEKYRIGYGGGFYDSFLKENEFLASFGVCLDEFILNKILIENFDEKVDFIFTEKRVF